MNLIQNFIQYGFFNSFKRLIKRIFGKLGFHYESFWYLANNIDIIDVKQKMQNYSYDLVKELNFDDFENSDSEILNEKKLNLIRSRFESGKYWSYGIIDNSTLVYYCWISIQNINFPSKYKKSISLNRNEACLEDAYCHPSFRRKKLHSKMNLYRLLKLHEFGKDKIIALVLSENTPALKVQLNSGFEKKKKITFITIFDKSYYIEKHLK